MFWNIQPTLVGDFPGIIQYHFGLKIFNPDNLPKKTFSVLHTDRNKIQSCLWIIISFQTDWSAVVDIWIVIVHFILVGTRHVVSVRMPCLYDITLNRFLPVYWIFFMIFLFFFYNLFAFFELQTYICCSGPRKLYGSWWPGTNPRFRTGVFLYPYDSILISNFGLIDNTIKFPLINFMSLMLLPWSLWKFFFFQSISCHICRLYKHRIRRNTKNRVLNYPPNSDTRYRLAACPGSK